MTDSTRPFAGKSLPSRQATECTDIDKQMNKMKNTQNKNNKHSMALVKTAKNINNSNTTDDDRRQRAKQYWPPTLCVGCMRASNNHTYICTNYEQMHT